MRRRGRPILGAIAGLFLGIFLAVDLQFFRIWSLTKASETILPAAGLVLGLLLGLVAPLGKPKSGY